MGRASELMIEMEEALWEESDVSFCCPECNADVDGNTELPVVFEDGGQEHLPITIRCFGCNNSFDGWVITDWDSCEIQLDDYPKLKVEAAPMRGFSNDYDDYDQEYYEWLDQLEQSSRPVYAAFAQTISEVKTLTSEALKGPQSQMLARMLLSQSITALEVFLADTLILTVTNSAKAQEKLLSSGSLGIGKNNFILSNAIGVQDFAKTKLLEYLRAVSFHDIMKVNRLFSIGLGINILPEGKELEMIKKAIRMRHDCVHRNGVDKVTHELHEIDQTFLQSLADTLQDMVKLVDQEVDEFETPF
ncbi:hypothetical protein L0664_16495 [Octadecabacter sp. G9-8]|uniref:RiboL-PSP-HEPN domain-containing protein n=1 Tax=Octadecabacter dasysiphoniae TaxID=2909341 RepID=A0ABS9D2Y8_9RHOB|nr:hypothetical protein [Octadecabacter dasysiphoniae]MCF2872673.1 hypothetical protein [Octadecabacter dasysiphoniae]